MTGPRSGTFATLGAATVVSNIGSWMYSAASGWLVIDRGQQDSSTASRRPSRATRLAANESIGQDRTTMPARKLITPKKITHPRPGRTGSLIADAAVDAPRKMNPTAIQIANSKYAYP